MARSSDITDAVPNRDERRVAAFPDGGQLRPAVDRDEAIAAATSSILWIADADGGMAEGHAAWERFTGLAPAESVGHRWLEAVHPADRDRVTAEWMDSVVNARGYEGKFRVRRRAGDYRRIMVRGVPVCEPDGRIREWVVAGTDATDRTRTTESLLDREVRYAWLAENTSDAVWRFEVDEPIPIDLPEDEQVDRCFRFGYLAECNAAMAAMYGFDSPRALIGLRLAELLPPHLPENVAYLRAFVRSGYRISEAESTEIAADGSSRHFVNSLIAEVVDGALLRAWGTSRDVTDRKRAEAELRQSRAMLRTVLDNIPQGVFWKDRNSVFLGMNAAAAKTAGFSKAEDVIGKTDFDLPGVTREQAEFFRLKDREVLESGTPQYDILESIRRQDGSTAWLNTHKLPLFDVHGNVIGVLGTAEDVTERRRTEEALRESESRFRAMADDAPVMVWVTDPDGACTFLGKSWYEFTGQAPEAGLDLGWVDAIHPDDRAAAKDSFLAANERREAYRVEYRLRRHDGEYRWAIDSATPRFRPMREFLGYIGSVMDITDRKRAEEAIRESEAWLRTVTDNLPAIVGYIDRDLRYRFVNRGCADWFAMEPDAILGKTIAEMLGQLTFEQRRPYIEAVLVGKQVRFEGVTRHRTLGWRDTEVIYTPDLDAAGRPRGFFTLVQDVTDRKRVERLHQEAEEQFRTLADNIPQLVWMADRTGWIFWYNRRWYEYTGTTPEQMEGWGWRSVHDPAELERMLPGWRRAIEAGEPWEDTIPLRRHDGEMRWHLSRAMPVRNERGEIVRWFGTNTDVTDQRDLEKALRETDRRKDEFLATLGHELRNPLASIVNAAEAIAVDGDGRDPAIDGDEMIEIVERQARHMSRLIDDLLDVSRIGRGKVLLRSERLDLAELVRQTAEDHRRGVEDAGLSLAVEVFNRPLWVQGDRTRLAQVLGNLLHNAVKFTDLGGRIIVAVALEEGHATIRVRDTGLGMTAEMLGRIFVPFSQADASLARSRGGLGLGLALVKGLVDLHGGIVSAQSEGLGHGAEFLLRFPIVESPIATGGGPIRTRIAAVRLRILAIDDRRDILRPLQVLLTREGHEVEVATTGRAGVDAAVRNRPDIVICDIGLPGELNGHDVARMLRGDPNLAGVRLIALTGYGQESDRQAALDAGFDLHLTKPVDIRVLRSALAGMMPVPR